MCGFCNPERYADADRMVIWGPRESIYAGLDENGCLVLYASGEESSFPFRLRYCPICGAKLPDVGKEDISK